MTFDFSTSHWNQTAFKAFLDLCLFQSFPFFSKRISDWPSGWIKFRVRQHDMKLVVGVAFAALCISALLPMHAMLLRLLPVDAL